MKESLSYPEMSEIGKLALSGKEADRLEFARRMAEAIPSE